MNNELANQEWYGHFVEECKAIITEAVFTSRWALVEGYWNLGKRVREDMNWSKGQQSGLYNSQDLAKSIGLSERTLNYALSTYDKYPDINKVPEGKNITWNKLITQYLPHVSHNSGENEWYTPPEIIEAARNTMGSIDLDPASSEEANKIVGADTFYTEEQDGLKQNWFENVWMNPPYSEPLIKHFTEMLVDKFIKGDVKQACVLVNNATETGWFQYLVSPCKALCLLKGRVKFIDKDGSPSGAPLQGQIVLYFGDNEGKFYRYFNPMGKVLSPTYGQRADN